MWERLDQDDPRRGGQRIARLLTVGAVALFWCVATAWRPWALFARAGYSADFYDEQARAFLRGRLHVDPAVAGIEGFVIDDRTYLYFGPALAVARLPTALAGRVFDGRLTLVSMLVALVVLATWAYRLLQVSGALLQSRDRPLGAWRTAAFVGAVVASPALFLAGWISVYHETELWACTFAVVAATCMLRLLHTADPPAGRWLVGACAATAAATLTRASVGIGVCLALVLVAAVVARRGDRRTGTWALGAAVASLGAHMAVNVAKVGTLLDLPADRQVLTLQDPERAAWFAGNDGSFFSLRFLPTTLLHALRPDTIRFERLVPGIRFGPPARDIGPYPVESITPASSLTTTAPVLVVLAAVGLVWLVRHRRWAAVFVVAGLVAGAAPSFAIGFVANRYLVDSLPALVVAGAVGIAVIGRPPMARAVVIVTIVWGLWVNAALATWTTGLKSPGFTEARYRIDAVIFPAPSPGLVALTPEARSGDAVPRDGVVALDGVGGECAGVYIAEQGSWVALERTEGRRVLRGTVAGAAATDDAHVLVEGSRWQLTLVDRGPAASIELVVDDATVAVLGLGALDVGDPVAVVADPRTREFSVTGPGGLILFDPEVPALDETLVPTGIDVTSPASPVLCHRLTHRLADR